MFLHLHVLMAAARHVGMYIIQDHKIISMNLNCWLVFQVSPVTMKTVSVERIAKQQACEEEVKKREGLER